MKKLIYGLLRRIIKIALHLYFSKIEINGKDNIPIDAPFIYAPNHQSAFMDALIVGGLSSLPVHYLTRSDIFKKPLLWILDALNMIPIYRMRDGYEKLSKNDAVFEACYKILNQGKPILIFPEGNHGRAYYLRPLTKGTARLALQAQEKLDKPLSVVPVGINMFRHDHPGYKLILSYGTPIQVSEYVDRADDDKPKTLNEFRKDLSDGMKETMLIPNKTDDYESKINVFSRANQRLTFEQLKIKMDSPPSTQQNYLPVLKPLMLFLMLPNFIGFSISYYVLNYVVKDPVFRASMKLAIGIFIFPLVWVITFLCFGFSWCWIIATLVLVIQISTLFLRQWIGRYVR